MYIKIYNRMKWMRYIIYMKISCHVLVNTSMGGVERGISCCSMWKVVTEIAGA